MKKDKRPKLLIPINEEKSRKTSRRAKEFIAFALAAFAILFAINGLWLFQKGLRFKRQITASAQTGYQHILFAADKLKNGDFQSADALFKQALNTFNNIENSAWFVAPVIPALAMRDPVFDAAGAVIASGKHLARAGISFNGSAKNLKNISENIFKQNALYAGERETPQTMESPAAQKPSLTEELKKELPAIERAGENIAKAELEISKIPRTFVPADLRERFDFAKTALASLTNFMASLRKDIPAILKLLGDKEPHTFLVLLQNNAELRPTGGFIGSFIIIETNDGYVTKSEFSDVYDADHQLDEIIAPPPEISHVSRRWFLRDSNYSGDFPTSAKKAAWFLEKEKGPGVDTVIAVDQTFVSKLLGLSGPVKIPELQKPLTEDNFTVIMSYLVESKTFGREDPKAALNSFMAQFQKALLNNVDPVALARLLDSAISEKHALGYSNDEEIEAFFTKHKLDGAMPRLTPRQDYLYIVHTAIGGNKSDDYISEEITHDTFIRPDGSLIDELTITRSHNWSAEIENRVRSIIQEFGLRPDIPEKTWWVLGRSRADHKLRIYVPAGSELLDNANPTVSTQFDEDTGKTYFTAGMLVPVGKSETLRIRYRLPFKLNLNPVDKYELFAQKQPGQKNITLSKRVIPEDKMTNYRFFPESGIAEIDGTLNYEEALNSDKSFISVWGEK